MTEAEITVAIQKWRKYAIVGDPKEPDYGDGMPAGYRSIGLESRYKSPQVWERDELQLEATKADYDFVEPVYQRMSEWDRATLKDWYFGERQTDPTMHQREVVGRFRKGVGRINAA